VGQLTLPDGYVISPKLTTASYPRGGALHRPASNGRRTGACHRSPRRAPRPRELPERGVPCVRSDPRHPGQWSSPGSWIPGGGHGTALGRGPGHRPAEQTTVAIAATRENARRARLSHASGTVHALSGAWSWRMTTRPPRRSAHSCVLVFTTMRPLAYSVTLVAALISAGMTLSVCGARISAVGPRRSPGDGCRAAAALAGAGRPAACGHGTHGRSRTMWRYGRRQTAYAPSAGPGRAAPGGDVSPQSRRSIRSLHFGLQHVNR